MTSFRMLLLAGTAAMCAASVDWKDMRSQTRALARETTCSNRRPAVTDRTFVSKVVDAAVESVATKLKDDTLACVFRNTAANTLDTTVSRFTPGTKMSNLGEHGPDAFVITGDIDAMWLRDSCNQLLPFVPFVNEDPELLQLLAGAVSRQAHQVNADPWANAHTYEGRSPDHTDDITTTCTFGPSRSDAMLPGIFERKYELDSLCAFFKLSRSLWAEVASTVPPFQWGNTLYGDVWFDAVNRAINTITTMQLSSAEEANIPGGPPYQFARMTTAPTDTLMHNVGAPAAATGMSRSSFRPSDDATTLPYLVPANAMAVVELRAVAAQLRQLIKTPWGANLAGSRATEVAATATAADALASQIAAGIAASGIVNHPQTKQPVYAYETDGFGNAMHMDDANVPSLLSLPYLGFVNSSDPVYKATRQVVLSNATNPWFFVGGACPMGGVGGPHVGLNSIWPMAIIMQAMTSDNDDEIAACIDQLVAATADTGLMHESFLSDSVSSYTRPWFAWANSLFGTLVFKIARERPHLLYK